MASPAPPPNPQPTPEESARARAFSTWFLILFVLGVGGLGGLNFWVNPWGLYPSRAFASRVSDDAAQKCDLLRAFSPAPEQLVLGSSRVMRVEPRYLTARTGLRTFNASVAAGGPVDALAMLRFAREDVKAPVRRVVLGLDALSFFGKRGNYERLTRNPDLRHLIPRRDAAGSPSSLSVLLSPAQARDALLSVQSRYFPKPTSTAKNAAEDQSAAPRHFEPDGLRGTYTEAERPLPPQEFARYAVRSLGQMQYNPKDEAPNPHVVRELQTLFQYLGRNHVQAFVFVTPAPDVLREHWKKTGFAARERQLVARIRQMAGAAGIQLHDFSTLQSFGGDGGAWYDPIHPMRLNTRRLVDALVPAEKLASGKIEPLPAPAPAPAPSVFQQAAASPSHRPARHLPSRSERPAPEPSSLPAPEAAVHADASEPPPALAPPEPAPDQPGTEVPPAPTPTPKPRRPARRVSGTSLASDDAYQKCLLLRRFHPGPEQLVLGSSRVMKLEPRYLEKRTGLRTFNAAVAAGAPIDSVALFRYATEVLHVPVKRVIVGVDVIAFFGRRGGYARLVHNPLLSALTPRREGPKPPAVRAAASNGGRGPRFERDGYRGRYAETPPRKQFTDQDWQRFTTQELNPPFDQPNPDVLREFETLLTLFQERGVEVALFTTPAPEALRSYWRDTGFEAAEQDIIVQLQQKAADFGFELHDFSTVSSFGGDDTAWYDPIHPTVRNTRRIIDTLFPPEQSARAL